MPKATAMSGKRRKTLKTAPPDGFVVLRKMTYGEKLERQQMATQQLVREQAPSGNRAQRRKKGSRGAPNEMELKILSRAVTEYEFARCVVEHNLEKDDGKPMDFSDPHTLDILDPRIGDEISAEIEDMNNFEESDEDDEEGN